MRSRIAVPFLAVVAALLVGCGSGAEAPSIDNSDVRAPDFGTPGTDASWDVDGGLIPPDTRTGPDGPAADWTDAGVDLTDGSGPPETAPADVVDLPDGAYPDLPDGADPDMPDGAEVVLPPANVLVAPAPGCVPGRVMQKNGVKLFGTFGRFAGRLPK